MSTLLAISAGSKKTAFVLVNPLTKQILGADCIPNETFLDRIRELDADSTRTAATQFLLPGGRVPKFNELLAVEWVGRMRQVLAEKGISVKRVFSQRMKATVWGTRKASDAEMRSALIEQWGAPGTKDSPGPTYSVRGTAWKALAVATTFLAEGASDERKEFLKP